MRRLKLTIETPGGHSWLHFGQPSAVHLMGSFIHLLSQVNPGEQPRTTYNVGVIEGGRSINTIASEAACYIDLRSTDPQALQALEQTVRSLPERLALPESRFHFEVVGDRPAGSIPQGHPLVRLAAEAHQAIGMQVELDAGSTDANIPLARGIPAVCVGLTYGGNAHRLDEYIEIEPLEKGMWQLLLLASAAANGAGAW
ncbi:MAG: M20/M25/M40 family metallo-hydrolase [Anaerolineae bacterium]|nr:M20/M25/M40 family metallo-hydrolase [Anaerolineae bacterium]